MPPALPEFDPTVPFPAESMDAAEGVNEKGMIGLIAAALAGLIPIGLAIFALVWWRRRARPIASAPRPTRPIMPAAAESQGNRAEPVRLERGTSSEMMPTGETIMLPAKPTRVENTQPGSPYPAAAGKAEPAVGEQGAFASTVTLAERPAQAEAPATNPSRVSYVDPEVPSDDVRNDSPALPRSAPQDAVERRNLIERMVDAAPDKANPFTSRKARAKRARLILASLNGDGRNGTPAFG